MKSDDVLDTIILCDCGTARRIAATYIRYEYIFVYYVAFCFYMDSLQLEDQRSYSVCKVEDHCDIAILLREISFSDTDAAKDYQNPTED